jgi:hypothetical protein
MAKRTDHISEACDERGDQAGSRIGICHSPPTLTLDVVNSASAPRLLDWLNGSGCDRQFAPGPEHSRWE